MFITRECDYAIRIVRGLADGERRLVQDLCDREMIPQQYAYKILKKLEKAGFVASYRGPGGGYQLARDPATFAIYDILVSLEEDIFIVECMKRGYRCDRDKPSAPCAVHKEFCRLQGIMVKAFKEKTMAQILQEHTEGDHNEREM